MDLARSELRVNACRKLGRRGNPKAPVAARRPAGAKAVATGRRDSSAEGIPSLRSALRQERGAGKRFSVLVVRAWCCPGRWRARQGIVSAKVISAHARPTKLARARVRESRNTPTGEGDHERSWWWGSNTPPPLEAGDALHGANRRRRGRPRFVSRTPVRARTGRSRSRLVGQAQARSSGIEGSSGCS